MNYITEKNTYNTHSSIVLSGCDDIVDLKNHLDDLCGEFQLILLGCGGLEDALLVHIGGALAECVDTDERILFRDLLLLDL